MLKRSARAVALITLLACITACFTGCMFTVGGDKYMTREEVESLIDQSMLGDITVEGGDNFTVNIEGADKPNVIAAAKGLLSSVSVSCYFEYSSGYGPSYTGSKTEMREGAGVIYRLDKNKGDAYIITNYHVVYEASATTKGRISDSMYIELYGMEDCGKEIACEYVGGSMYYDIAVLKVEGSRIIAESNAVAAEFADSSDVCVLDTAIAIGNPEGDGISATVGYINVDSEIIEMLASDEKTVILVRVMRIDTPVNHGNSGGGLFNDKGQLIGIVNAKTDSTEVENIGYALPSTLVASVVKNILDNCNGDTVTSVQRCMLGIAVGIKDKYTEYDTETGRLHKKEQVIVTSVKSNGAADGKIQEGDIIRAIRIDGMLYEVDRTFKATETMLNARVGSLVVVYLTRGGNEIEVTVPITAECVTEW